jgi:hypothetical protein
MAAATGPRVPDADRAETYLRLRAEAELQLALTFPRYSPRPQPRLPPPMRRALLTARRQARRRAAARRAGLAGRAQAFTPTTGGPVRRLLGRVTDQVLMGGHRLAWRLQRTGIRRFSRGYEPPKAQECLERVATLARALATVGALTDGTADVVVEELDLALSARHLIDPRHLRFDWRFRTRRRHRGPVTPAGPMRAVPVATAVDYTIDGEAARVYFGSLMLDGQVASLTVAAKFPAKLFEHGPHGHPAAFEVLHNCTATDDRGAQYQPGFSGGGSADHWAGTLDFNPVPAAGVRWLDVHLPGADSVRVDLTALPPTMPTSAVALPADGRAGRYVDTLAVDLLLSGTGPEPPDAADSEPVTTVAHLIAAGVLPAGDPALGRFAAAAQQIGLQLPAALAHLQPASIPADWLSMLARRDDADGPVGVVPAGAVLPELEGARCVVAELRSEPESAMLQVHARGWPEASHLRSSYGSAVSFRWTARDDVGGFYLAEEQGGSYSDHRADFELGLMPAINPRARTLEVILTGRDGAVSVTMPLDWREGL